MLKLIKNKLGNLKRALVGFLINNVEKTQPINSLLKPLDLGETSSGQKIEYYKVGQGQIKIVFVSAIHGNEVGTVKLSHELINWLFENRKDFKEFTFFIVPCLNLGGYNLALKNPDYLNGGRMGRFNNNSVDLNRNFDTPTFKQKSTWVHGKNYSEITEVFCGAHGSSEPEIMALTNLLKKEKPSFIFSFHNAGKDVVANKLQEAQKMAKFFSEITGYRFIDVKGWQSFNQTGSTLEWCTINNFPLLEIELSNRWGSDWLVLQKAFKNILNKLTGL